MSDPKQTSSLAPVPSGPRPFAMPDREPRPALPNRLARWVGGELVPRAGWAISRTGRAGLVGLVLLFTAAMFLVSTHLRVAADVEALRGDLEAAQGRPRTSSSTRAAAAEKRALPPRTEMPSILRQLFSKAARAQLAIDIGKYDVKPTGPGGVVRHQLTFPVTGTYPQIRRFIDASLAAMPAVALTDLSLERKAIGDGKVEAQIRMTVYTTAAGAEPAADKKTETAVASNAGPADRVVQPVHALALFAAHTWAAPPPPPAPPPPAAPPPPPTAPPFPYTVVGSFAPKGEPQVYFLSSRDRMIDARVGDKLDGVYKFESAAGNQLVFTYLPLNIRQNVAAGASR